MTKSWRESFGQDRPTSAEKISTRNTAESDREFSAEMMKPEVSYARIVAGSVRTDSVHARDGCLMAGEKNRTAHQISKMEFPLIAEWSGGGAFAARKPATKAVPLAKDCFEVGMASCHLVQYTRAV